jgi:hypothetical protein
VRNFRRKRGEVFFERSLTDPRNSEERKLQIKNNQKIETVHIHLGWMRIEFAALLEKGLFLRYKEKDKELIQGKKVNRNKGKEFESIHNAEKKK